MQAVNPVTGEVFGESFGRSDASELSRLADRAGEAVDAMADADGSVLASFLEHYASRIEADRDGLAALAHEETALPLAPRLSEVELGRTTGQLRAAAACLRDESWRVVATDDAASLRSTLGPLGGAVLSIGPSNFPLAFNGVSGGDFAAAIVARNPVIAKAHPGHPGTSARLFSHARAARDEVGLPEGAVQLFHDCTPEDGERLLAHRAVAALAVTGSRTSGLRLKAVCDRLGKPSSLELAGVNPLFVPKAAAAARAEEIADAWSASVLLGGGQFCTKPGVAFVVGVDAAARFIARAREVLTAAAPAVLLTESTRTHLVRAVASLAEIGASIECGGKAGSPGIRFAPTLVSVDAACASRHREAVMQEAFGPLGTVVACGSDDELVDFAREMEGQLAATIAADAADADARSRLHRVLRFRVGRLLDEAMPTGVAVSPAMVHGGPFPATGDPRFTAVGLPASARRFSKALCLDRVH